MSSDSHTGANTQNPAAEDLSHPFLVRHDEWNPAGTESREDFWRQEIVNRVDRYRRRRDRKNLSGQFSMRFDFEPTPAPCDAGLSQAAQDEAMVSELAPEAVVGAAEALRTSPAMPEGNAGLQAEHCGPPEAPPQDGRHDPAGLEMETGATLLPGSTGFLAESEAHDSPRFWTWELDAPYHELADPVLRKPRILDVPETLPVAAPRLADVALPDNREERDEIPAPDLELPPPAAPLARRLLAALIDVTVVLLASAAFGTIALHGEHLRLNFSLHREGIDAMKPVLILGLAAPFLFWSAYHYLFLVHAAATPGMSLTRLRLTTFDGGPVQRRARRGRAMLMALSFASLGLGFLWALFDQDVLCWHDRVTRTCLKSE